MQSLKLELVQNPPARINSPPVDSRGSESGWLGVPVNEISPPKDNPPPLSMVLDRISKSPPNGWANEKLAAACKEAAPALMINLLKKIPFKINRLHSFGWNYIFIKWLNLLVR